MVRDLLTETGLEPEPVDEGVTKVELDLGEERVLPLLLFHHDGLELDGERLVRICAHTAFGLDDPKLFHLLERAGELAVGGFLSPGEDILLGYTTYLDGLDAEALARVATAIAWTAWGLNRGDMGSVPARLDAPAEPPEPVDAAKLLRDLAGGDASLYREGKGSVDVAVSVGDEGVQFLSPDRLEMEGVTQVSLLSPGALAGDPLLLVCAGLGRVESAEAGAPLAGGLTELAARLQLGAFFSPGKQAVLFGHSALGRVLTPQRLARVIALVAETSVAAVKTE